MQAAHRAKRFLMTIIGVVMVLAALVFGMIPTTAVARAATTTATPLPPGTVVHAASCEQAPPQIAKDRANYSAADLARYGLPPRTPGEPFEKWAKIVRNAGQRYCDYTLGASIPVQSPSVVQVHSLNWAGYVADQSVPNQNYTETDMDYFVPTVTIPSGVNAGKTPTGMGAWIGLGGDPANAANPVLVQIGTYAKQVGSSVTYKAFWENTGSGQGPHDINNFTVNAGDHFYVKVYGGNCVYIQRVWNSGDNFGACSGPITDGKTAEAIVEHNNIEPYFANFGSITFKGVGVTDNSNYKGIGQLPHYWSELYDCTRWQYPSCVGGPNSKVLAHVDPLVDDPGNPPSYLCKFTVEWRDYGNRVQ